MSNIRMGGSNVFTATAGIRFSDGTEQDTAAVGVTIDGSTIGSVNFNSTIPTPPVGFTNVIFQTDINGNTTAYVAAPAAAEWFFLIGDLSENQVIPWDGPTVGTPDSGISRIGIGSLAIGNGTVGDTSGSLTLSTLFASTVDTVALHAIGAIFDSTGSPGTLGQVLESTITGTAWTSRVTADFYQVVAKTSNYTANSGDDVWCTGTFTVTLPTPGDLVRVKVTNRGTGIITVVGSINGNSSLIIARQYSSAEFASDGTNWDVE